MKLGETKALVTPALGANYQTLLNRMCQPCIEVEGGGCKMNGRFVVGRFESLVQRMVRRVVQSLL